MGLMQHNTYKVREKESTHQTYDIGLFFRERITRGRLTDPSETLEFTTIVIFNITILRYYH